MSALPYQHPRRKQGPLEANERVKITDADGVARSHGTVWRTTGDASGEQYAYVTWDQRDDRSQTYLPVRRLSRIG